MKYKIELPTGFAVAGPSATHIDGNEGEVSVPLRRVAPKPPATVELHDRISDHLQAHAEAANLKCGFMCRELLDEAAGVLMGRAALAAEAGAEQPVCSCGDFEPDKWAGKVISKLREVDWQNDTQVFEARLFVDAASQDAYYAGARWQRCPVHGGDR